VHGGLQYLLHRRVLRAGNRHHAHPPGRHIKTNFPHIYLYTSTNGLAFSEPQARRLVHSGIDEVTFSIDGATQEAYARYRQRGRLEVALSNLAAMADEKRRTGRDLPFLNWRYILFKWNDSDQEMNRARQLAAEIGVDRLCWEITDHPEHAFSRRFVPGSPELDSIRAETWDDNNLGNAIPGATPRARIEVRTILPGIPLVTNLSARPFPASATYGRRLVRVGAQLCAEDGTLINRDYARADLPETLAPGKSLPVSLRFPPLTDRGTYTVKFDLVSEGVDWFERCGSPTTLKKLWVR